MNITVEHKSSLEGLAGPVGDYHTTLLDEYKFTRKTARFQNVTYWDVWDAGEDCLTGNSGDGYRLVGGQGVTLEGHGEGIRVLVNGKLSPLDLIKYLKGLVEFLVDARERSAKSDLF